MDNLNLLTPTQIIKSRRRTISLVIKNNGDFIVKSPLKCQEDEIYKFIKEKEHWILTKRQEQLINLHSKLTFNMFDKITLLENQYDIFYTDTKHIIVRDNKIFVPNINSKQKLISFLKTYALDYFTNKTKEIATKFDFQYTSVQISSTKSCWGSCNVNNILKFTYKLLFCPECVIQYIILHELCHTKIKNHSKNFWNLVKKYMPEYKTQEKWLKSNRSIIEII